MIPAMRHGSQPGLSSRAECPCLDTGEFFGRQLAARTVGSLHLTDYVYAPGVRTPRHRHSQPYFNIILEGGYTERTGAGLCEPVRSCVLFHPAGESHADHFGAVPTRIFSVEMRPAFLRRSADLAPAIDRPLFLGPGPAAEVASRLYREFRRPDGAAEIGVDALALELLTLLLPQAEAEGPRRDGPPAWLRGARDLLHDRYAEGVTLDDLGASAGVHPLHLARAFRRYFGCSVGGYVRRLRVEAASRALLGTDDPLVRVARRFGFTDQSHFTRVFARIMGVPPGRFRLDHAGSRGAPRARAVQDGRADQE